MNNPSNLLKSGFVDNSTIASEQGLRIRPPGGGTTNKGKRSNFRVWLVKETKQVGPIRWQ